MSSSKHVVLVVEDELLLRLNAVAMLQQVGYAILQAASAAEAITLLERNSDIRAVFTDINLPGSMDGMRLAAVIRDRWPPVELIVTSGRVKVKEGQLPERGKFLPKPYTGAQLSQVLDSFHFH